jgi:hypothetical protein
MKENTLRLRYLLRYVIVAVNVYLTIRDKLAAPYLDVSFGRARLSTGKADES